jgi:hypothetical protein
MYQNEVEIEAAYFKMSVNSDYIFWTIQGVLALAVICFCILGYKYILDKNIAYDFDDGQS